MDGKNLFIFDFFQSFFPRVSGTTKDDNFGSKVKGNAETEGTHQMMGETLTIYIKVNITVTLHLKSQALVAGKARRVLVLRGPAGRIAISIVLFLVFLLEALPTCVIVWPLSACLLRSAMLCSRLFPPPSPSLARLLAASLRTDPYRLTSLLFLPEASRPRAALSELAHMYSIYYYCCARVCPQQPPLPLSLSLLQGSL